MEIETTRHLLQIVNKSKIIFASADRSIKKKALSLGATAFLTKPFKLDDLIKIIKKISMTQIYV